jgi:hypothetical protein
VSIIVVDAVITDIVSLFIAKPAAQPEESLPIFG